MAEWRRALLKQLGFKPTPQNLKFLATWQRWEGGHTNNDARFNWLNTTQEAPGAVGSINSVGVKRFNNFQNGIRATARTLSNGFYNDILDGLASGNPYTAGIDRGLQTWVAGPNGSNPGYVRKILGDAAPEPLPARAGKAAKRWKALTQQPRAAAPQNEAWNTAMSMIFDDDPEFAELMAQMDDTVAQKAGVVSPRGSLKQPAITQGGDVGALLKMAATQLGKPYVFGSGPGTDSFDCSDLIQWAYKQIGVSLPRVTYDQIKAGRSVKGKKLQPGDLIFPHRGHVVMYVGNGKVIAAPYTGTVVQYQPVPSNPLEVRRVL